MQFKFNDFNCKIKFGKYACGQIAIQLIDAEDGCPLAAATVAIPEVNLKENEVLIKNWSENEGVLEALIAAGVIEDLRQEVPTGFVAARLCRLLVTPS